MNINIKPLLSAYTVLVLVLLLLLGVVASMFASNGTNMISNQLTNGIVVKTIFDDIKYHITEIQQFITDSAATGDEDGLVNAKKELDETIGLMNKLVVAAPKYKTEAEDMMVKADSLYEIGLRMVNAYKKGRSEGNVIMKQKGGFDEASDALKERIGKLEQDVTMNLDKIMAVMVSNLYFSVKMILLISMVVLIVSIIGSIFLYRKIIGLLGAEPYEAVKLAQQITDGDLAFEINYDHEKMKSSLIAQLSFMKARWTDLATGLRGQANLMNNAARNLTNESRGLAENCLQQSRGTEAITAEIEELSTRIELISEEAIKASSVVKDIGHKADESARLVVQVTKEISTIAQIVSVSAQQIALLGEKSNEIGSIVNLIKEIAEQTNLLALNAAIEAARAGESGRGFAVVADEVRKLAERTTGSTLSISKVIEEVIQATNMIVESINKGVERVKSGVSITEDAANSMQLICNISHEASERTMEVSHMLTEQRKAAQNITSHIINISSMTENNAGTSETVSKASEYLQTIANAIEGEISFFKLANHNEDEVLF